MERDLSRDIDHVVAELQARCRPCAAAPPWRGALRHGPRAQEDIARSQRDKAEMQAVRSRTPLLAGINQTSLPLSYPSHCSHIPLIALISLSSLSYPSHRSSPGRRGRARRRGWRSTWRASRASSSPRAARWCPAVRVVVVVVVLLLLSLLLQVAACVAAAPARLP
jgi:uncharacterized integral membrane protein